MLANYELIDLNRNRVSSNNLKTSESRVVVSNCLNFNNGEKQCINTKKNFPSTIKSHQRIDHSDKKSLEKTNLNPFLSEPEVANDSNIDKFLPVKGSIPTTKEDTRDACYACDACTQTDRSYNRIGCCVM